MNNEPAPDSMPSTMRKEALIVWMKLVGLLVGLSAFGGVIFLLSRMINHR